MIQLLVGVGMFLVGIKILKRSVQPQTPPPSNQPTFNIDQHIQTLAQLQHQYETTHAQYKSSLELYRTTAHDAMNREYRAKSALVAALKASGSTPQEITKVLQTIEEPEQE